MSVFRVDPTFLHVWAFLHYIRLLRKKAEETTVVMMRLQYSEIRTLGLFVLLIIYLDRLFNFGLFDTVSNMKVQSNRQLS
jgi:hypothetical protein